MCVRGIPHVAGLHFVGHEVGSLWLPDSWRTEGGRAVLVYPRSLFRGLGVHVDGHEVGLEHPTNPNGGAALGGDGD